jgi:signal transduction histidine kinase/CheY-like chemotaxis protein
MTAIINELNKLTEDFHENAKQLENFIQQFATLTELTEITARIPDIDELLNHVLKKAMASTHSRRGTIMLVREDGAGLEIVAAEGWRPSTTGPIRLHDSLAGSVIEDGEPLLIEDIDKTEEFGHRGSREEYSSSSCLIMPLKAQLATIGSLCLSEKSVGGSFGMRDQQFLTIMLGQIGYAVENARLLHQARRAANSLKEIVENQEEKLQDAHAQIIQSEKLSALGQLIAGVAHELNNPLTSVVGYTGLVIEAEDKNTEKVGRRLETVLSEANRATRIVQNLLTFSRARKSTKRAVNLNEIAKNILSLREYDLKARGISLSTELDEQLPLTAADSDQIQQVVLNLVNNSAQAMRDDRPKIIVIGSSREEGWVHLWVEDTGKGIPEEITGRIFEPFFSTKGEQTNTGLGLNISSGIVKEHGGEILVDSKVGRGTRMTVRLPIASVLVEEDSPPSTNGKKAYPKVTDRKALVVDDEPPIAELMEEILTDAGFTVESFTNGMDALENLGKFDYDLVVTDIRMPHIDGQKLYLRMREDKNRMIGKFIMTSGDVADPQVRLFASTNRIPLLAKPFRKDQFLDAIFGEVDGKKSILEESGVSS